MSKRLTVAIVPLVLLSIVVQIVFLASPGRAGLPLDDGWIHATYARNLARHGQLCLNPGEPSTGTTSFLWTGLLAALHFLGVGPVAAPIVWGVPLQACLVVVVFLLVRDAGLGERWAFVAGGLCALLGNLVWISLAGMEATLFLVLALGAIWCRSRGWFLAAGVLAGLLVLTRPEGAALALAMGLAELPALWRRDLGRWRVWLKLFLAPLVAAGIYVAINLAVNGQPVTATFAGRRWLAGQPATIDFGPLAILGRVGSFFTAWFRYLYRWVFGTVLLAWLGVGGAEVVGAVASVALCWTALAGLVGTVRQARRGGEGQSPLALLLVWTLLHNAAYVLLLPVHGHAGRYQAVNFVLLAILVMVGTALLARPRSALRRLAPVPLALWLALCLGSTTLWRVIYRDSVEHINATHVACGRWIAKHLPPDAVVGTYDLGAVAYHADRRVVDLGGLVDPAMARHLFAGDCAPYLRDQGATHLAMVQHATEDHGLLRALGLWPPAPGRPALHRLEHWSVPPERYHLHHIATSNAAPFMVLYRLGWPDPPPARQPASRLEARTPSGSLCWRLTTTRRSGMVTTLEPSGGQAGTMANSKEHMMGDEPLIAVFVDFENLAIGVRDMNQGPFKIDLVLRRLLEKGRIVFKRAYCDWKHHRDAVAELHRHGVEMVDIPASKVSGKNSADIHMVTDAMDLCYSKDHIDVFALISGDSDFSPLAAKLKENNKRVIGCGVKSSTSDLLMENCDEFILYDDLVRASQKTRKTKRRKRKDPKKQEAFDRVCEIAGSLALDHDVVWASMVKQAIKRVYPGFNENYYGYSSFGKLLEDMRKEGLVELGEERPGNYSVRFPTNGG